MKIVGVSNQISFKTKDGQTIEGRSIYLTAPLDIGRGTGEITDKVFLSTAKWAALGFVPAVGDEVDVLFNRFGKVQSLVLVDAEID